MSHPALTQLRALRYFKKRSLPWYPHLLDWLLLEDRLQNVLNSRENGKRDDDPRRVCRAE